MRKLTALISAFVCILVLTGCGTKQLPPDTPDATVPAIMYEGELYRSTGKEMPGEVDESAIVGRIGSVIPLSQLPANDREANFGQIGDPYAVTRDGLVVIVDHEWVLFEPFQK